MAGRQPGRRTDGGRLLLHCRTRRSRAVDQRAAARRRPRGDLRGHRPVRRPAARRQLRHADHRHGRLLPAGRRAGGQSGHPKVGVAADLHVRAARARGELQRGLRRLGQRHQRGLVRHRGGCGGIGAGGSLRCGVEPAAPPARRLGGSRLGGAQCDDAGAPAVGRAVSRPDGAAGTADGDGGAGRSDRVRRRDDRAAHRRQSRRPQRLARCHAARASRSGGRGAATVGGVFRRLCRARWRDGGTASAAAGDRWRAGVGLRRNLFPDAPPYRPSVAADAPQLAPACQEGVA